MVLFCFAQLSFGKTIRILMETVPDTRYIEELLPEFEKETGIKVETEVIGTKATIKIASAPQKSLVQILDNKEIAKECFQSFKDRFKQAFINEIQEFINCIVQSRKPEITIEDGIQATLIAEKATESFRENKQLYF